MKRLSTLFFVACIFTLTALAHEISAEQSLRKAVSKISEKSYAKQVSDKGDFALVHTERSTQNGKALYYVFSNGNRGGFVISGADHRANAVLGYTENGTYEQALQIPAFREWLSSCQEAMQWLSDNEDSASESEIPQIDIPDRVVTNAGNTMSMTIPGRRYTQDATLPTSVEPLLAGINWDQSEPFNRLCPYIPNSDIQTITGCVATATAQIMKYYEWPLQGTGSVKYVSKGAANVELEADFSQSVYDWDNMLGEYNGDYTDEQAYAVAKLMSDVGIAERMDYGLESSTHHYYTTYALATFFGYNKGIERCQRLYYNYAEWNNLLKRELAESRPVCFGGSNFYDYAGHEFVLDGYNEDGNYHVNWGWSGMSNGYYDINFMCPKNQGNGGSNGGYPGGQEMNINCFPDKDGTSVAHYKIIAGTEPFLDLNDGKFKCHIRNAGIGDYSGKFGFVAVIDNEVVGAAYKEVENLGYMNDYELEILVDALNIPFENLAEGKLCQVYPVFVDGEEVKVPLSQVSFQNYVLLGMNEEGQISTMLNSKDNAAPICENITITRDFKGYDVKGKALISNMEGAKVFDRPIIMAIYKGDLDNLLAFGVNFAYINPSDSRELEFKCNVKMNGGVLELGETYDVALFIEVFGTIMPIPGSNTTVTIKDAGGDPSLSYSDFTLDKTVIAPKEDIMISFKAENTGGFYVETFQPALFKVGVDQSIAPLPKVEADLPNGTTTISCSGNIEFGEGEYFIAIFANDGQQWNPISGALYFEVKESASAIVNVTDNTNLSNQYYDLQGRRVANPTKGIYIKGGKKVVKE